MADSEKAKRNVEKQADQASNLLNEASERFSTFKGQAKARGEQLMESAKERGGDLWDQAQDQGKGALKDAETLIRKNPIAAVGCAILAGMVLYAIFGKNNNEETI